MNYLGCLISGLLVVVVLNVPGVSARADEVKFVTMLLAPYGFKDDANKSSGYLFDVANAIAKEAGFAIRNDVVPVKRLHQKMVKGTSECTLAARLPYTEVYQMIEPLGFSISLVIMPHSGISLEKYDDLIGKRVAVARGTLGAFKKFADDDRMNRVMTSGYRQNMLMLDRGRVDAVLGAYGSLMFNLRQLGLKEAIVGNPLIFNQTPMWLICSNHLKDKVKIDRLRAATRRLNKDGTIRMIIGSYIGRILESAYNTKN